MTDARIPRPRFCSQCGNPLVVSDASFCKDCGAPLASAPLLTVQNGWQARKAATLSLIPGLGHWYKGQRGRAVGWFVLVGWLYLAAWPIGFAVHLICAANAAFKGAASTGTVAGGGRRRLFPVRGRRWGVSASPPGF